MRCLILAGLCFNVSIYLCQRHFVLLGCYLKGLVVNVIKGSVEISESMTAAATRAVQSVSHTGQSREAI